MRVCVPASVPCYQQRDCHTKNKATAATLLRLLSLLRIALAKEFSDGQPTDSALERSSQYRPSFPPVPPQLEMEKAFVR
jgi:hypothetical protein